MVKGIEKEELKLNPKAGYLVLRPVTSFFTVSWLNPK